VHECGHEHGLSRPRKARYPEPHRRIEQMRAEIRDGAGGEPCLFDDIAKVDGHGRGDAGNGLTAGFLRWVLAGSL